MKVSGNIICHVACQHDVRWIRQPHKLVSLTQVTPVCVTIFRQVIIASREFNFRYLFFFFSLIEGFRKCMVMVV